MTEFNPSNLNYDFKDFIGIYENAFTKNECEDMINLFEIFDKKKLTHRRVSEEADSRVLFYKNDTFCYVEDQKIIEPFSQRFWTLFYPIYTNQYTVLKLLQVKLVDFKVQKTSLTEGYHLWHHEHGSGKNANRICAWTLYLNDVEDGGETEFLYQSLRVKPKTGTFILFPAHFTHTHRGNPPLSGEKYIATGWIEYECSEKKIEEKQKFNYD